MIELPLSFGRWNRLTNVLDFSESNINNSCISDSTLRLKGCINSIFSKACCEELSQTQKTGLEWSIYAKTQKKGLEWSIYARNLRELSLNGLP